MQLTAKEPQGFTFDPDAKKLTPAIEGATPDLTLRALNWYDTQEVFAKP